MQERTRRRLLSQPHFVGLGFALLLLVAVAIASYVSWNEYIGAANQTRETRTLINSLKDLVDGVQAAESAQRGFLLTGNAQYLDSYSRWAPDVRNNLTALAGLTLVQAVHPALFRRLREDVLTKLQELNQTIALKREGNAPAALALVNTNRGKAAMDEIRSLEQRLEGDLDARLAGTQQSARYFARMSQLICTFGSAGIFLIVLISAAEIHRLVSTRSRLNAELSRSVADFQHLADSVPQMIWQISDHGTVEYVNQRWIDFSGLSLAEMAGESWEALLHRDDRKDFLQRWRICVQAGESFSGECRLRDRFSGRYRWFLFRATPVSAGESGRVRWFATYTNIDQQKAAEQALQRSNEDLQQFVYSASHDLQEPLRTLMVYSDIITKRGKREFDDRDALYLRMLRESAERMRTLVADLLTYTEAVSSGPERDVSTNPSSVLQKVFENLRATISESGAEIICGDLPRVQISEVHLLQIFQNLLGNALKYRKPDVPPRIEITAAPGMGEVVISVRDNGIGIDPAYHAQIFGIFKRLHASSQYSGSGLGLAICKKIVERNHGRIWVESESGAGATFYVSLPGVSGEAASGAQESRKSYAV